MAGGKIFLNYRRDDTAGHAGRVYDRLKQRLPDRVFRDVTSLEPGVDFVEAIHRAIGTCQVMIVLIGKWWLSLKDDAGRRRLDLPDDHVRIEIVTALRRGIKVIPVLCSGAKMPDPQDLPEDLAPLARRQAIELTEPDFDHDFDRLIEFLGRELGEPLTPQNREQVERLLAEAQRAANVEHWPKAIQVLQDALALDPGSEEIAARLRAAHHQQRLGGILAQGQRYYEAGQRDQALQCFRQVRVLAGGNYKDVDTLIAMLAPPRKKRWFARTAVVVGMLLVGALVAVVIQVLETTGSMGASPPPGARAADDAPVYAAVKPQPEPPARPAVPVAAEPFFRPVGQWRLVAGAMTILLTTTPDRAFTAQVPAGYMVLPGSAGQWAYDESQRLFVLSGMNMQGMAFIVRLTIRNQHEDHYHASSPDFPVQDVTLTRIGG